MNNTDSNSSFFGMCAVAYKLILVSYDDDYYYGQVYRSWKAENAGDVHHLKQFITNVKVDLDDFAEVHLTETINIDRQTIVDFEIESTGKDQYEEFCEVISNAIPDHMQPFIYEVIKLKGGYFDLIIKE